jgi:hypothetical protein
MVFALNPSTMENNSLKMPVLDIMLPCSQAIESRLTSSSTQKPISVQLSPHSWGKLLSTLISNGENSFQNSRIFMNVKMKTHPHQPKGTHIFLREGKNNFIG